MTIFLSLIALGVGLLIGYLLTRYLTREIPPPAYCRECFHSKVATVTEWQVRESTWNCTAQTWERVTFWTPNEKSACDVVNFSRAILATRERSVLVCRRWNPDISDSNWCGDQNPHCRCARYEAANPPME